MLTADLLRVKDNGKTIQPRYVNIAKPGKRTNQYIARAAGLISRFKSHVGKPRLELEESILDFVGDQTDFAVTRGLQKLLQDRSVFDTVAPVEPSVVRDVVFELATRYHPIVGERDTLHPTDRGAFLKIAVEHLVAHLDKEGIPYTAPITPEAIDAALYADLEDEQHLLSFDPIEPIALINRYNLALAQAVLYRASVLNVRLTGGAPKKYRQLFRFAKFCQLMHTVRKRGPRTYDLILDGPMSLFSSTQKYGLQMAVFLPALLLVDNWKMEAELQWGPRREPRAFTLEADTSTLKSHYKSRGVYITDEQKHLEKRLKAIDSHWTVSRDANIIDLGGRDLVVPDLVFTHKEDGRVAYLEIVGFWRKGWIESKAKNLEKFGPENLIIAIGERLRTDRDKYKLEALKGFTLYTFKGVILAKRILELVEQVAVAPKRARRG